MSSHTASYSSTSVTCVVLRWGARKRILDKSDIDAFPFPNILELTKEQRVEIVRLADMLDAPRERDWKRLDAFIGGLFGLTKAEQQVVSDTVTFNGPYAVVREQAMRNVPQEEADAFVSTLERAIQPFFKAVGQKVRASLVPRMEGDWRQPWAFITLLLEGDSWKPSKKLIADLVAEVSASAASRLVMPLASRGLILGLLNNDGSGHEVEPVSTHCTSQRNIWSVAFLCPLANEPRLLHPRVWCASSPVGCSMDRRHSSSFGEGIRDDPS